MATKKLCGGILDYKNYTKALKLLKKQGINYVDIGVGFDRYYWYRGIYRVTKNKVYMIYTFGSLLPYRGECLDFRDCSFRARIGF